MNQSASRTCPECQQPLEVVLHEGVELDRCGGGHGVWLDRGELRAVVSSEVADRSEHEERAALDAATTDIGTAVVADTGRAARACPVCSTAMQVVEYAASGVPIDECRIHGFWLDAGELERIEAYAEGLRSVARPGGAVAAVSGIQIPADLLNTIRTVGVPPPA